MSRNSVLTDEQSKLNARLEAHMVYICPECGKAFRTQAEWRQHLNTKHDYLKKTYSDFNFIQIDENFHECQLCLKWVENAHKTIALLQYHYFMHLDHRETYRCVHCRLAYTRRRALNEHLLSTHIKEIEKYEAKLKQVKRSQEEKKAPKSKGARQPRRRNDLLQKALMDIDLQTEDQDVAAPSANPSVKAKPNASEQALDRCLNAYEDIVRKEMEQKQSQDVQNEADLDALCQEFFEERLEETDKAEKPTEARPQQSKEVVIIEIDALGKDEVDKLKKKMKTEPKTDTEITPSPKRRRLTTTPERDGDVDVSISGLAKLISYLCPTCGKEIESMDDWRSHVFKKHNFEHYIENSFKIKDRQSICLQCNEVQHTTKRTDLQKHCFKHLPFRSYLKCTLCDRTKTSMSKMYNHIRYNHQEELQRKNKTQLLIKPEPKWTIPQRSVNHRESSEPDRRINEPEEERICKYCNKVFKTFWRFERHATLCKAHSAPKSMSDMTADSLLKHLREGRLRMNTIWKKMQMEVC
ncbi:transcription factor E4F1 [Drosophila novamexicana]|uniref:transcription factor E4F1 n=1 Tax=Drosophila novamexicana TaxID=47314 RepID=UPI0011E5E4FB|nr:transcription factor E4F1 [Drosophila novamexicana]